MEKICWHAKLFSDREEVGFKGRKEKYDFIHLQNSKFIIFGKYAKSKSHLKKSTYYLCSLETENLILKSNYVINIISKKSSNLISIEKSSNCEKYIFEVLDVKKDINCVIEEEADIENLKNSKFFDYVGKYIFFDIMHELYVAENNEIFIVDKNNKKIEIKNNSIRNNKCFKFLKLKHLDAVESLLIFECCNTDKNENDIYANVYSTITEELKFKSFTKL